MTTPSNDTNLLRGNKKYLSFSEFYTDVYRLPLITELYLTPKEGFFIKDLYDLEMKKVYFNVLSKLDVSENIISKLVLKSFVNLRTIIASKNMIKEVNLILPKLVVLDLSYNFLTKIFDLSTLPCLKELNLSNNLIEKVTTKDFQIIKFTLTDLYLDNNKINFEANEFLSFIEGLKIFNLVKFSLDGNDFIQKNKSLTYSYNLFIVATISSLKNLNHQDIIINRENLLLDSIKNQILAEDESIQLNNLKKKNIEKDDKPDNKFKIVELKDLENNFIDINKNFDNVLKSGGKNQKVFFTLMDSVNFVLNSEINEDIIKDAVNKELDTEFIGLFNLFLMNCLLLIEMNENLENTVLNPVAQFALFGNGSLCDKCFDFFESLIKSSSSRTENILVVFETAILKKLEESHKQLPFNCLKVIIKFFQNTKISFSKLYKNLINVIIKEFKKIIFENYDNPLELVKERQNSILEEEKVLLKSNSLIDNIKLFKNYNKSNENNIETESKMNGSIDNFDDILITCLQFINEYWKIPESELVDEDDNMNKSNDDDFIDEEKEDDEDIVAKLLQEDVEVQNENLVLNNSNSSDKNITLELFELCVFTIGYYFESLDNLLNIENKKFDLIDSVINLGISLCQNIDKHIKSNNFNIAKINYIKEQFTFFNVRKAYGKEDEKETLNDGDGFNIVETLSLFIQQTLGSYLFNPLYFYEYSKKYFPISNIETILENEKKVRIVISNIVHLFGCFIKNINDNSFKIMVDEKGTSICFQILCSNNNDPFILTGACKFFYEVLNYHKIMGDQMSFSKIMTKITNLKSILNFIDYENIKYRQVCETIHKFDSTVIINNSPVTFEKLENENILELIEFIVTLISQICLMANRVGAITTQCIHMVRSIRESKMFSILGNCLKINNDNVRRSVVNCIYYNDHTTITNDIIKQIINIIGTYSSVSEGDTEIILSTIYLILNKIMNESNNNDQSICQISDTNISESIHLAMDFLLRNTDRNIPELNEIDQKNSLSVCLIIYLNSCSAIPKHWLSIERNEIEKVIHGCLYNDFIYYNSLRYIPIEIERTYIGNFIGFLFEIMSPSNPVLPYSYVFLRILIKIGDVLMNLKEALFPIDYSKEIEMMIEDMKSDLHKRFSFKIENETRNWYEFERLMKYDLNENNFEENKKEKKISYIKELSEDDHLDQLLNFVVFFPNFVTFLLGKTSFLVDLGISNVINQKIDKNLISCENIYFLMEEYNKSNIISNTELIDKSFETVFLSDYRHLTKYPHKNDKYKFSNFITNYLICSRNNITYDWHNKKPSYYGVFYKDLTDYSQYGLHTDSKRFKDEENHNNPHLRSLIISAFIRCIYCILVSPYKIVRFNFMEIVLNNNLLKDIIFLSDITLIFEYNIHYKIFSVIELLFSKNNIKIIEKQKNNFILYRNLYFNSHLASVFLHKILNFYHEMKILSKQNLEISFCKDIISCLKEFINYVVFLDLEKINIDMEFTRYWILQNVAKPFIYDIFFYILNEIVKNVHSTLQDISNITVDKLKNKNISYVKNQMLNYILNLEQNIYDIRDILAFYVVFYPSSKEYIFNHILKAYIKTDNIEKEDQSSKGKKSGAAKTLERVLLRSQIINISYNLSKKLEEFVDYMDICEYFYYPQKKSTLMILTLTETKFMLFEKKEENNNISLGDKIEYSLDDIEAIFLYDYYNRIFLVFRGRENENDQNNNYNMLGNKNYIYFSLFFKNLVKSFMFIDKLKVKKADISLIQFNTFHITLHKILEEQKGAIIEKINIEGADENNGEEDEEENKIDVEYYSKKYAIKNNIYSYLNEFTFLKFGDYECFFVISLNYKTLIDYFNFLNILYDDTSLLIDHKKILCINRGFLYIFRESFDRFNLTIDEISTVPDENKVVSCNSSEAYDLLILIKIKNIVEVTVDEHKLMAKICYKIGEKTENATHLYLEFSFSDNFEFYLFYYYINLVTQKVKGMSFNKQNDINLNMKGISDSILSTEKYQTVQSVNII